MWFVKRYTECSPAELLDFLQLRIDTFVVEQKRNFHEIDAYDRTAWHIFYRQPQTQALTAYARIFEKEEQTVTFGRVVVAPSARGTGLGKELTAKIIEVAQQKWPNQPILIEAQAYIVGLYQAFGFVTIGEPFIFEGSPHVTMCYLNEKT